MVANQNTTRRFEETPLVGTTRQNPTLRHTQALDSIHPLRQNDSPIRPLFAQVGLILEVFPPGALPAVSETGVFRSLIVHTMLSIARPASVIVNQITSICRPLARIVPGSVRASPSETSPFSSPRLKPCAN